MNDLLNSLWRAYGSAGVLLVLFELVAGCVGTYDPEVLPLLFPDCAVCGCVAVSLVKIQTTVTTPATRIATPATIRRTMMRDLLFFGGG